MRCPSPFDIFHFLISVCSVIFWKGGSFHNILEASNIKRSFQNFTEASKKKWNIDTQNKMEEIKKLEKNILYIKKIVILNNK